LGAAGPALQGFANLSICSIVDFSDLAHVRKVLKTETLENVETDETVETVKKSDVMGFGLEIREEVADMRLERGLEERADMRLERGTEEKAETQLERAIKTQDSAFIIAEAAAILSQCYETVSEDVVLPSQGDDQTEEPPSKNISTAREIESNVDASDSGSDSDAVFPKNAHCFDAHELDPENVTKVFEASMSRNDLGKQELCVFAAIKSGYIEDLEHDLSEDNVDLHGRDSRNRTCADFAAVMGRLDMVQLILEKGGTFGVFARSVMMPLARERDEARKERTRDNTDVLVRVNLVN
jgi:hypothetical protein